MFKSPYNLAIISSMGGFSINMSFILYVVDKVVISSAGLMIWGSKSMVNLFLSFFTKVAPCDPSFHNMA